MELITAIADENQYLFSQKTFIEDIRSTSILDV